MKRVTIVLYPDYPLAGEGNDNRMLIRTLNVTVPASDSTQEEAERAAMQIAQENSCHAQVWDIV
jgi:hypothetical protein